MRKLLRSLFLVLFLSPLALAQFTLVSGTVTDPNGLPYALGTITAQLVTAGVSPTVNGSSFAMAASAGLNSAGSFTMQLVSNALMVPSTLQWSFTVCSAQGTIQPAGGNGSQCFTVLITISGASQSISSTLSAAAPALSVPASPVLAKFDQVAIHASISATTIYTPTVSALYKVTMYFSQDVACTVIGSGVINLGLVWTDGVQTNTDTNLLNGGQQWLSSIVGPGFNSTVLSGAGTGVFVPQVYSLYSLAGHPIQVSTIYASCTTPANNNYDFHVTVTY